MDIRIRIGSHRLSPGDMGCIKFKKYKLFNNMAVRDFYSLLRPIILGAKSAGLLNVLINSRTLSIIMGKMPAMDWKQQAMDQACVDAEGLQGAFENFMEQKGKTS